MPQAVLSQNEFDQMFPRATEYWPYFAEEGGACDEFAISNTRERQAAFFAQIDHESSGLTRLEESFAYSPARLRSVWPFRFRTAKSARDLVARGHEAIASYVYANRMGNGSPKTGDGWKYRGRGFIQLTGSNNYAEFGAALSLPLITIPSMAALPVHAARIAARFWATRGCNEMVDAGDFRSITRAINGGLTGLRERTQTWHRFRTVLELKEQLS